MIKLKLKIKIKAEKRIQVKESYKNVKKAKQGKGKE